ncbi:MAG: PIN domain-containing protein [Alphaproteobacteria bacterium]|nr:PIN domain-containing protein [Alphaproteobacteria bacterium]
MILVDTNILVHAANVRDPRHQPAREAVNKLCRQAGAWYLTWGICFEFLAVVTHRRVLPKPLSVDDAWMFIAAVCDAPGLQFLVPTERFASVAAEVLAEAKGLTGSELHDAETAILMREHGVKIIYTRDTGFHRFKFLEVIDPTA